MNDGWGDRTTILTLAGVKELRHVGINDRIWNGSEYLAIASLDTSKRHGMVMNAGKGNMLQCGADTVLYNNGTATPAGDYRTRDRDMFADNIGRDADANARLSSLIPADLSSVVNDKSFAWLYGVWSACGFYDGIVKFHLPTTTSTEMMCKCVEKMGDRIVQLDTGVFEFSQNGAVMDGIMVIQRDRKKASIANYHLVVDDVFKVFFLGFMSGRGYVKVEDDGTWNAHFSTNNEKIAYGIQFELYKRFGIRAAVKMSKNSKQQPTYKSTLIGGATLMGAFPELLDIYGVASGGIVPQQEFASNKLFVVSECPGICCMSFRLEKETDVPVCGFIKTHVPCQN